MRSRRLGVVKEVAETWAASRFQARGGRPWCRWDRQPTADRTAQWFAASRHAPARVRPPAPDDFTTRVMARLDAGAARVHVAPPRSQHAHRLKLVAWGIGYLWIALLAIAFIATLLRPSLPFDALHALVSGFLLLAATLRHVAGLLGLLTANTSLMLGVTALLSGLLVFWSQAARPSGRAPREA